MSWVVAATGLWSLVHGLISLLNNGQIPGRLLERTPPRELLLEILGAQLRSPPPVGPRSPAPSARPEGRRTRPRRG